MINKKTRLSHGKFCHAASVFLFIYSRRSILDLNYS
nr:MAG TPA: hypothetical protein [Caudoviricetes sp.]